MPDFYLADVVARAIILKLKLSSLVLDSCRVLVRQKEKVAHATPFTLNGNPALVCELGAQICKVQIRSRWRSWPSASHLTLTSYHKEFFFPLPLSNTEKRTKVKL